MSRTDLETLQIKLPEFELVISGDKLGAPRKLIGRTYTSRSLALPNTHDFDVLVDNQPISLSNGLPLSEPFFFENKPYWFDIQFGSNVEPDSIAVTHKHRQIEESFSKNPRRNELRAMINFGNDIGVCNFEISYHVDGEIKTVPVKFTVFATKMVQTADLPLMNEQIDNIYPFWRYAITSKTTQAQGRSAKQNEKFELFWLAQFERLVDEFNQGVKRILNAPHNRLQTYASHHRLDRINKRLSDRQQEKARELLEAKRDTSRLRLERKRLSINTPENRFIKMILNRTKKNLGQLIAIIEQNAEGSASTSYINQLSSWRIQVGKHLLHQMWNEVGQYEGKNSESKVLQEASGYSKVYRVWQQLKHYLGQAIGDASLSVKSVADIYEIWCFLEVQTIITSLGFNEISRNLNSLKKSQFERQFPTDELAAAFVYLRESDGMKVELAHNPSFTPRGKDNRTWLANQKPDIVLRVTLINGEQFLILFDAKYRIDSSSTRPEDRVPEDAINQMHRYRDAIIHQQRFQNEKPMKSRPVMGSFALYPGFFDQNKENNPYDEAIQEIGIGAFALLPSGDKRKLHNQWLKSYLTRKLGAHLFYPPTQKPPSNDYYFVEDASRIVPYGTKTVRHHGLTMVAPINEISRDQSYLDKARSGKLAGYHTQLLATNRQSVHRNIVREIRYVLVTVRDTDTEQDQVGWYLYRVGSVKLMPRKDIEEEFTGKPSDARQHYWLFEFIGNPIELKKPIMQPYREHFEFKLTKVEYLDVLSHWDEIRDDYLLYTELDREW